MTAPLHPALPLLLRALVVLGVVAALSLLWHDIWLWAALVLGLLLVVGVPTSLQEQGRGAADPAVPQASFAVPCEGAAVGADCSA